MSDPEYSTACAICEREDPTFEFPKGYIPIFWILVCDDCVHRLVVKELQVKEELEHE